MLPSQPNNLFPRPFAASGNKQIIPDAQAATGRASCQDGFPSETQLPLSQGGVAPNRTDFNGILFMLSAFAHWQQSGGLWTWRSDLDYAPPAMVYHAGNFWICLAQSGPSTGAGAQTPGTPTAKPYWQNAFDYLAAAALAAGGGIPDDIGTTTRSRDIPGGKYLAIVNGRVAGVDLPAPPARVDDIGTSTRSRDIWAGAVIAVGGNGYLTGLDPATLGGNKQDAFVGTFDTIGSVVWATPKDSSGDPRLGQLIAGSELRVSHFKGDNPIATDITLPGTWIALSDFLIGGGHPRNGLFRRVA